MGQSCFRLYEMNIIDGATRTLTHLQRVQNRVRITRKLELHQVEGNPFELNSWKEETNYFEKETLFFSFSRVFGSFGAKPENKL